MSSGIEYELRKIPAGDRDLIAQVVAESWARDPRARPPRQERMNWLYRDNPAGHATLIALRARDQWVGMVALVPRRLWQKGVASRAYVPVDFVINVAHRTAMPALKLQRAAQAFAAEEGALFYAAPNTRSLPIFRRLGCSHELRQRRVVHVLHYQPYVSERLAMSVAAGALGYLGAVRDSIRAVSARNLRLRTVDSFDARFDRLWEFAKIGRFLGERSSSFLTWRFREEPRRDNEILVLEDRSGELVGYVVGQCVERVYRVRDWLCAMDSSGSAAMLARLAVHLRKRECDSISFLLHPDEVASAAFQRAGFVEREQSPLFVTGAAETQPDLLYLTRADEDV